MSTGAPGFSTRCRNLLSLIGIDVRRVQRTAGDFRRPVGAIHSFLEDVRARGFLPETIFDVGALTGEWTQMALSVFPESKFLMIEPQLKMEPHLEKLSAASDRVRYLIAGAGREPGQLVMNIGVDPAATSFLQGADAEASSICSRTLTKVMTLDDIVANSGWSTPDLVKLDVQGFELEALAGARSLFGRTEVFILETSLFRFAGQMPLTRECMEFMNQRGYELYDITEFRRRPFDGALGQVDLAFAKADGFLRRNNKWK